MITDRTEYFEVTQEIPLPDKYRGLYDRCFVVKYKKDKPVTEEKEMTRLEALHWCIEKPEENIVVTKCGDETRELFSSWDGALMVREPGEQGYVSSNWTHYNNFRKKLPEPESFKEVDSIIENQFGTTSDGFPPVNHLFVGDFLKKLARSIIARKKECGK